MFEEGNKSISDEKERKEKKYSNRKKRRKTKCVFHKSNEEQSMCYRIERESASIHVTVQNQDHATNIE